VFSTPKRELLGQLSDYYLHVTEIVRLPYYEHSSRNFIHSRSNSNILQSSKLHWLDLTSTDLAAAVTCSLTHQVNTRKLEEVKYTVVTQSGDYLKASQREKTAYNSSTVYMGFMGNKVSVEQVFLQYFVFPNQLSFQQCSTIIRAKDMGLTQVAMPQCHGCTPSDLGSCPVATFQTQRSGTGTSSFVTRDFRTCPKSIPKNLFIYTRIYKIFTINVKPCKDT